MEAHGVMRSARVARERRLRYVNSTNEVTLPPLKPLGSLLKELMPYVDEDSPMPQCGPFHLENSNPVHNLWSFYQHATVLPIMSEGARESIIEYQKRGASASVADVLNWHESRFSESGKEIPELWQKHLELFRAPDGKFVCVEENLARLADKDGDGEIDWAEFVSADFQQCFV